MTTYLKRFYFDDWKLRERAILEFTKAVETGRLIAFTGSMATEDAGYGTWEELVERYIAKAAELIGNNDEPVKRRMEEAIERIGWGVTDTKIDHRVLVGAARESLALLDDAVPNGKLEQKLVNAIASEFGRTSPSGERADTVDALVEFLGIRRFATLNYDLELEKRLMSMPWERKTRSALEVIKRLQKDKVIFSAPDVPNRLGRILSNGSYVESDIRTRERPDRMIEFSVGSVDVDMRIMHLHGRADVPDSMIVGLRDYDRLYRKDDVAKLPFEHGQRILFGGNPVLFVGVGMSEREVNEELRRLVSNNPYRRFAPAFLLWNTTSFAEDDGKRHDQMALQRMDFLQRLGVYTIFDEDLARDVEERQALRNVRSEYAKDKARAVVLKQLPSVIRQLARTAKDADKQVRKFPHRWRSMRRRLISSAPGNSSAGSPDERPIMLWGPARKPTEEELGVELNAAPAASLNAGNHLVILGDSGIGKGSLAYRLAISPFGTPFSVPLPNRLLIKAGFAFDTDSLLSGVAAFLRKLKGDDLRHFVKASREAQFRKPDAFATHEDALIIISGIQRFFSAAGSPLSAELDHLLRRIVLCDPCSSRVRWIFLGTERVRHYFETIKATNVVRIDAICSNIKVNDEQHENQRKVRSWYLSRLLDAMTSKEKGGQGRDASFAARAIIETHRKGSGEERRRAVVGALFEPRSIEGEKAPQLLLEVLKAMAFIGAPVEGVVLLHAPQVRKACGRNPARLQAVLKRALELRLIVDIQPFEDNPNPCEEGKALWARYGLHREIASELRSQFGLPLSEAKLSTAFNMSLYVAQPVDGYVPERHIHKELSELVDHLSAAYKDSLQPGESVAPDALANHHVQLARAADEIIPRLDDNDPRRTNLEAVCAPSVTAALRAALAVVRGFYSTTGLLTIDRGDRLITDDHDGVLVEHAERLERLLRAFRKLTFVREKIIGEEETESEGEAAILRAIGPEPFYPDELVWIHNELGVVYLAQGDLYSARRAFRDALRVNERSVEHGCRSHNWRRITMNRVLLEIERANLSTAERLLDEIEDAINEGPCASDAHEGNGSTERPRLAEKLRFGRIRSRYGSRNARDVSIFHPDFMHEEILMTGLVLGFRGLCEHLRGHTTTADLRYQDAIAILRRLGEQRAYAHFQRLYAQVATVRGRLDGVPAEMELAVSAAESVRQMDIVYHGRINRALMTWKHGARDHEVQRRSLQQIQEGLSYAILMDLHRLRVEASMWLSEVKLESGDYETALEHATEAMTLATRYGLSLRKVSLRIRIGQILIRRGDRKSGAALIESAIEAADRFGFQTAVRQAQQVRAHEGMAGLDESRR